MSAAGAALAAELRTAANGQRLIQELAAEQIEALTGGADHALTRAGQETLAALREIRTLAAGARELLEALARRLESTADTPESVRAKAEQAVAVLAAARQSFGGPPLGSAPKGRPS